jgi:hypothetical protein
VFAAECAGGVESAVDFAEAVGQKVDADLALRGGFFACGVNRAARFAVGLGQTGRAAHHFDAVVKRQIGGVGRVAVGAAEAEAAGRADLACHAVFFKLLDKVAARHEVGAAAGLENVDAGGGFQRVFQRGDALVFELFFGNDGNGLGNVFRCENQAGGGAQGGGGVAVAVFRAQAAVFGGNGDLRHAFAFFYVVCLCGGVGGGMAGEEGKGEGGEFER